MENNYLDGRGYPRIVITGMGALTPLGLTAEESWQATLTGKSGVARITQFDPVNLPCTIAGEVKGFEPKKYMSFKEARRMSRCSQLAVGAATMAVEDAGISLPLINPERVGTLVGTGFGGIDTAIENFDIFRDRGVARINPFAMTKALPNMPSHHVSVLTGAMGPISTVVTACATGTQAVGEAADLIRHGRADMMFAGGVEGMIHPVAIAGFAAMRALCITHNDDPTRASRPFDKNRNGFVYSEGSAILVLERLDLALARNAKIYAEYLGYATASDAFHVAKPDPNGAGAIRAMTWALADAGVTTDQISYINAHGTSTPINGAAETNAIKQFFGRQAYNIPVSSTKSLMGHAMGGSGAIEAIFCAYALQNDIVPATWNYETPDPECDLDYVPNAPRELDVQVVLSNSFGLGGQNACLVLGKYAGGGV